MSEERCFCHLNGYAVKDATARREIATMQTDKVSQEQLTETVSGINTSIQSVADRQTAVERQFAYLEVPGNAAELPFTSDGTSLTADNTQSAIYEVNQKVDSLAIPDATLVSFDGTDSGLEADNVQDAIDEVVEKLLEAGTVRFVDDETDENYGWVQYRLTDGTWVNWELVETNTYPLYMSSANEGNFIAYKGCDASAGSISQLPSVTFGESMNFGASHTTTTASGSVITSEPIDLTYFKKIKLHHLSTSNPADTYSYVSLFVTSSKQEYMDGKIVARTILASNFSGSKEGDVELDITAIEGDYYIGICCQANGNSVSTQISAMYME